MNGALALNRFKTCLIIIFVISAFTLFIAQTAAAAKTTISDEKTLNQALADQNTTDIDLIPTDGADPATIKLSSSLSDIKGSVNINGHNSLLDFNGFGGFKTVAGGNMDGLRNLTVTNTYGAKGAGLNVSGSLLNGLDNVVFANNTVTGGSVVSVDKGLSGGINNSRFENNLSGNSYNVAVTGDLNGGINHTVLRQPLKIEHYCRIC